MKGWRRSFTVEGLNLERLLRTAGSSGIAITSVRRRSARKLTATARECDMEALRRLAEEGGWGFTPGARHGMGRLLERCRKRWLLTGGLLLGLLLVMAGTQVMWSIDLVDAGVYEADIRAALADMGVQAPMLRAQVKPAEIRDALEWRYPRIAWIECGWRGMSMVIRVVEGVLPLEEGQADGSCDVVAVRDGIVSSIVTRAGTPVVQIGDLVHAGQVLIKGEERTSGGLTRVVAARGSVYARVWEAASVSMPAYETETIYTGRQQTVWTVRSPWFDLWRMEDSGFAQQDTAVSEMPLGGFFFPLTLRTETRMEAECTPKPRDMQQLREDSARAALQKLHEKAGGKESLVDNWVNWSMIEDEILLSVAYGERLMDIAQQERAPVMAAAE